MKNERCLIKICLLILVFIFNTGFYYDNNIYSDLKEIEVELGSPIPVSEQDYVTILLEANNITIESNVPTDEHGNTITAGEYNYYIVYVDNNQMFSKENQRGIIRIIDTTKPEIIVNEKKLTYYSGSKININKIAKCVDYSKCSVKFENKIDNKKIGDQVVTIIATDESGNTNQKEIKINIKKKKVSTGSGTGSFSKMNEKNNALNASLSSDEKDSLRHQIIEYAKRFVGNPYVYGGTSLTKGTDCSGFTMKVYGHFGYSLPRVAVSQSLVGKRVSYSELIPGDLVVYHYDNGGGHVGIYIGGGKMVHAGTPKTGIEITKIFKGNRTYHRIIY